MLLWLYVYIMLSWLYIYFVIIHENNQFLALLESDLQANR